MLATKDELGHPQDIEAILSYPTLMHPGDSRFMKDGIQVEAFEGRIALEIRVGHIRVGSHENNPNNFINIKGKNERQSIGLYFEANESAPVNCRKEIGIFLWQYRVAWLRLMLFMSVLFILIFPAAAVAFRTSFLAMNVQVGEAIVFSLPIAAIISVIFTGRRLKEIFKEMYEKGISLQLPLGAFGTIGSIQLKERSEKLDLKHDSINFWINLSKDRVTFPWL